MKYDLQQNLISGSSLWQSKVSAVFIYSVICPARVRALQSGFCKLHALLAKDMNELCDTFESK